MILSVTLSEQENKVERKNKRVLIIDDMNEMRSMLKEMVVSLGYSKEKIDIEGSGQAAIKLIMNNYYDVVLSDYNLGGNINGQVILETVRRTYVLDNTTIFIMITADVSYNCVINIIEYEPDGYIVKPFTKADFARRFKKVENQKSIFYKLNNARKERNYNDMQIFAKEIMVSHPYFKNQCLKLEGESLLFQKKYKEAKKHYFKALDVNKEFYWAYYGIALCEIELGFINQAFNYLNYIIKCNRNFLPAYDSLADLKIKKGDYESAQSTMIDLIKLSPYSLKRAERLGILSTKVQDWENVEKIYSHIINLTKDTNKEKLYYYYNHLQSINNLSEKEDFNIKLVDKFKRSLSRLRYFGKDKPIVTTNSFRLEINQHLIRNHKKEAMRSWNHWNELIKKGQASSIKESQEIDIKKRLGLY